MAYSRHASADRSGRIALLLVAISGIVVFVVLVADLAMNAFG